jgi:glycosyltransferase involved in cell wall biosynthesis
MTSVPTGDPVRVVVLDHTGELGGAELALVRLLDAVREEYGERYAVTVVLFASGPLAERLSLAGHEVVVLPLDPGLGTVARHDASGLAGVRSALRAVPFVWRLARRLRDLDAAVVHSTSLKADLVAAPASVIARVPLVWHVHDRIAPDYLPRPVVAIIRTLARTVPRRVVVNSEATALTLPGARGLTVAYPGLTPDQVASAPRAERRGAPVVGLVGRISPTKGQLELVRAAPRVVAQCPDVTFRFVGAATFGDNAYEELVRAEVERLDLGDRVAFAGFTDDPAQELDRLAVVVHVATVPEPFGQVVAEALARGVAVVATRGGGVDEIMRPEPDGPIGWTVDAFDEEALTRAIIETVTNPDEVHARTERGRRSVAARFPIARTARTVAGTWDQVTRR